MATQAANATSQGSGGGMFNSFFSGAVSNLAIAIIILLAGFIIGKLVGKLLQKILHDIETDNFLRKTLKFKFSAEEFVSVSVAYIIYFIAIVSALRKLGITTSILNVIAVAIVLVIAISLFLTIKDFIPNAIAGIALTRNRSLKEGDFIRVKQIEGRIAKINLTETIIETKGHDMIYIPNSMLTKNEVAKLRKNSRSPQAG